jgi:hypothetical protein
VQRDVIQYNVLAIVFDFCLNEAPAYFDAVVPCIRGNRGVEKTT